MDKLQWLKERQKGIGSSDVAAIMGMSKYKTAFQVYIEKTEEITEIPETEEAAYWGNNLKELIAVEFSKRTGKQVEKVDKQLVHREYPFMIANLDRRIIGENSILSCRTANAFGAKEWNGEEIPPSYILQCQHCMEVAEADKCYLAVLIGGQRLLIKEIDRDKELIEMMIEAEKEFCIDHVEKRMPPPLDGSSAAEKYLREKYPGLKIFLQINLRTENKDKITKYLGIKENIKVLEEEAKVIENNLKQELGQASSGIIDNFIVNWKAVASNRIDSKVLKDKYPEVYKKVCKESINRRFEIKEAM